MAHFLSLTGFDDDELADLFDSDTEAKEDKFDVDKALEADPFVKPGDVWKIGEHRLMCDDSTKSDKVKILMDGKKANLCITDSPYNCSYKGGTGMTIMNDSCTDSQKFYQFLLDTFKTSMTTLPMGVLLLFPIGC